MRPQPARLSQGREPLPTTPREASPATRAEPPSRATPERPESIAEAPHTVDVDANRLAEEFIEEALRQSSEPASDFERQSGSFGISTTADVVPKAVQLAEGPSAQPLFLRAQEAPGEAFAAVLPGTTCDLLGDTDDSDAEDYLAEYLAEYSDSDTDDSAGGDQNAED